MPKLVASKSFVDACSRTQVVVEDPFESEFDPVRVAAHVPEGEHRVKCEWDETLKLLYSAGVNRPHSREFEKTEVTTEQKSAAEDVHVPGRCARTLHGFVNSKRSSCIVCQIFYFLLSGVHCTCYMVDLHDMTKDELKKFTSWIIGTGVPLLIFTVLELLIRIEAQTGHLWRVSSWRRFVGPLFHKLEMAVLFIMFGRACMSSYLLVLAVTEAQLSDHVHSSDRMTVGVILFYRAMRAYGIFHEVSVQTSEKRWRDAESEATVWMKEHEANLEEHNAKFVVRCQKSVDQKHVQWAIFLFVLGHCAIYGFTRTFDGWDRLYWCTKPTGYLIMMIFAFEFTVRCKAEGGELFFIPTLHKIEAFFLGLGMFMIAYSTWYHSAVKEGRSKFELAGSLTGSILAAHRFLRFVGIWYGVSASKVGAQSVFAAQANKMFNAKFGDVLQVPPRNMQIDLGTNSNSTTFKFEKAMINPKAMEGIHLPITVRGGFVEEFHVSIPQPKLLSARNVEPLTLLTIRNMLLILGPGEGLAEASGLEPAGNYWDYERVLEAKAKLVQLLVKRLTPPPVAQSSDDKAKMTEADKAEHDLNGAFANPLSEDVVEEDDDAEMVSAATSSGGSKSHKGGWNPKAALAALKEKTKAASISRLTKRIQVQIQNITVQYEDDAGRLGRGHVTVGGKVGKILFDRKQGFFSKAYISRVGIFIETQTRSEAILRKMEREEKANALKHSHDTKSVVSEKTERSGREPTLNAVCPQVPPPHELHLWRTNLCQKLQAEYIWTDRAENNEDVKFLVGNVSAGDVATPAQIRRLKDKKAFQRFNGQFIEAGPKVTLKNINKLDMLERLWAVAFESMAANKPLTDRQRHLRVERWHENRYIFFIANISINGEPICGGNQDDTSNEQRPSRVPSKDETLKTGRKVSSKEVREWEWDVATSLIRVSFDDEQVRCLRCLEACIKAWFICDNAFKWRPHVSRDGKRELEKLMRSLPLEPEVRSLLRKLEFCMPAQAADLLRDVQDVQLISNAKEKKAVLDELRGMAEQKLAESEDARRMTSQLWWIYAVHRAMARQNVKLKTPWVDMNWRAINRYQYTSLLSEVVQGTHVNTHHLQDWNWTKWQARWANELEVRLPIADVVACRKQAMGKIASKLAAHRKEVKDLRRRIMSYRGDQEQRPSDSSHLSHASRSAKHIGEALMGGRSDEAADHAIRTMKSTYSAVKDSGVQLAASAAEAAVSAGEHAVAAALAAGEAVAAKSSAASALNPKASTGRASITSAAEPVPVQHGMEAMFVNNMAGVWKIEVPQVDIRVLRWKSFPRPVLLHAKARSLQLVMEARACSGVGHQRQSEAIAHGGKLAHGAVAALLTVAVVDVTCPQAGNLAVGGGHRILAVTRPFRVHEKLSSRICLRPSILQDSSQDGKTDGRKQRVFEGGIMLAPGERGVVEVYTPDLRIVIFEPLIVVLLGYLKADEEVGIIAKRKQSQLPIRKRQAKRRVPPLSKKARAHPSRGLVVSTGRVGPLKQSVEVNDTEASVALATLKTTFHQYLDKVMSFNSKQKKLAKSQKLFEILTGMRLETHDWDLSFHIGAKHCLQVGEYSNEGVLVEEYRVWPFHMTMARGTRRVYDDLGLPVDEAALVPFDKEVVLEANRQGCLPCWDDSVWDVQAPVAVQGSIKRWPNCNVDLDLVEEGFFFKPQEEAVVESSSDSSVVDCKTPWCNRTCRGASDGVFCNATSTIQAERKQTTRSFSKQLYPPATETNFGDQASANDACAHPGAAATTPTVEVAFRIVPRTVFSNVWIERENAQWCQAVRGSSPLLA